MRISSDLEVACAFLLSISVIAYLSNNKMAEGRNYGDFKKNFKSLRNLRVPIRPKAVTNEKCYS
jgi:hypothetical protein